MSAGLYSIEAFLNQILENLRSDRIAPLDADDRQTLYQIQELTAKLFVETEYAENRRKYSKLIPELPIIGESQYKPMFILRQPLDIPEIEPLPFGRSIESRPNMIDYQFRSEYVMPNLETIKELFRLVYGEVEEVSAVYKSADKVLYEHIWRFTREEHHTEPEWLSGAILGGIFAMLVCIALQMLW